MIPGVASKQEELDRDQWGRIFRDRPLKNAVWGDYTKKFRNAQGQKDFGKATALTSHNRRKTHNGG